MIDPPKASNKCRLTCFQLFFDTDTYLVFLWASHRSLETLQAKNPRKSLKKRLPGLPIWSLKRVPKMSKLLQKDPYCRRRKTLHIPKILWRN